MGHMYSVQDNGQWVQVEMSWTYQNDGVAVIFLFVSVCSLSRKEQ